MNLYYFKIKRICFFLSQKNNQTLYRDRFKRVNVEFHIPCSFAGLSLSISDS